ncbi:MAG: hypothetical protein J5925_06260 [Clostridia bacterium]|nr:hypothetical protein [Clostridia bacterium]
MEFIYDNEVCRHALLENESVIQLLKPGKKSYFFYRVVIPSALLSLAVVALLLVNVFYTVINGTPFTGTIYIVLTVLTVPTVLVYYLIQKKMYLKRAYYLTDKRILLVGGIFHLKYQTLGYHFIGSVTEKRTPFSKLFHLESHSISVIMNVHKQLSIKFLSLTGNTLSYLEDPDEAYKRIVRMSVGQ